MELTGVLADVQIAPRVMPKAGHQYTFQEKPELTDFSAMGMYPPDFKQKNPVVFTTGYGKVVHAMLFIATTSGYCFVYENGMCPVLYSYNLLLGQYLFHDRLKH